MSKKLPLYGTVKQCPKCGYKINQWWDIVKSPPLYDAEHDVILRRCGRCDAVWREAPFDREAKP